MIGAQHARRFFTEASEGSKGLGRSWIRNSYLRFLLLNLRLSKPRADDFGAEVVCLFVQRMHSGFFTEGSEGNKDRIGLEPFALFVSFCLRFFQLAALLRIGLDD